MIWGPSLVVVLEVQDYLLAALEVVVSTWVVGAWVEEVEVGVEEAQLTVSTVVVMEGEVVLEWVWPRGAQDMVRHPMLRELTAPNVMCPVLAEYPE
jgi:hypothetical protein